MTKAIYIQNMLLGYFEKGYSGKSVINIKSVDENGKLEVEIKSNTSLYLKKCFSFIKQTGAIMKQKVKGVIHIMCNMYYPLFFMTFII